MANIKDIAKKAGVSISTVSYALNNSPKVGAKTRSRIIKIAQEFKYHPNIAARNLKLRKTKTICLFLKYLIGPYVAKIIKSIQDRLVKMEYEMIMAAMFAGNGSQTVIDFITGGRVDGAIIFGASFLPTSIMDELISRKFPLVMFDIEPFDENIDFENKSIIYINNQKGASDVMEHLINRGYKKIGYIGGLKDSYDNQIRYQVYLDFLKKNNLEYNSKWDITCDFAGEIANQNIIKLIKTKNIPQAFFCANDQMAIEVIHAFKDRGFVIPRDIAIVGFDNIEMSNLIEPLLTTVGYNRYLMGDTAAKILLQMLKNEPYAASVKIDTQLIIRNSS